MIFDHMKNCGEPKVFNPLSANVPLLYSLKTSDSRRFSVFWGYRSRTLVENGSIYLRKY